MPFEAVRSAIARHPGPPEPPPEPPFNEAAVAMVLRDGGAGRLPELLMIRRAEHPGDPWSGHMAFPGGRRDPTDPSPEVTARRESMEELSLDLDGALPLGALAPIRSPKLLPRPTLQVHVFVYGLPSPPSLVPNREVASTHWFDLRRLMDDEGRGSFPYTWRGDRVRMPCIRLDDCLIWGMSLRMIDDLLVRLRREGL